jgi:hypothetical protein
MSTVCHGFSVTFRVNMNGQTVSGDGVHIAGSFQGWDPATTQLIGDNQGIYSFTTDLSSGSYSYKFLNGNTWNTSENSTSSCFLNDGSGNFNRTIEVLDSDTVLNIYCFNSCDICEPSVEPVETNLITFIVNMSNQVVSPDGIHIAGNFQNWNPSTTLMEDIGNGLYSYTLETAEWANLSFKFINGIDWPQSETVPSSCGLPDGFGGYNRLLETGSNDFTYGPICFGECADCEVVVEPTFVTVLFQVDMSNEIVSPQGVHVAGNFQGWNPNGTVMTELGGGIYELTYQVEANQTIEFKFINGSEWAQAESVPSECGIDDNNGAFSRTLIIGEENAVFGPVCFSECAQCVAPVPVMLLFQVNMSNESVSAEGVRVVGSFNNWDLNANVLSDSGNGIYQALVFVESGQQIQFKYVNGADWAFAENVPADCSVDDGSGNLNRFVEMGTETITLEPVCFGTCSNCEVIPMVQVTFKVNMSNETVNPTGVYVAGSFNDFSPTSSQMVSQGNGLYSFTASIPENTSVTYKFLNGNDWLYTELVPFECGISDGFGGYNRNIVTDNVDFELPYVCFSSCADCEANIKEDETSKLSIYPNPNNGEFTLVGLKGNQTVYIFNSSGQLIKFINSNGRSTLNIDLSEFEAGLYQIVTGGITSSTVLITK